MNKFIKSDYKEQGPKKPLKVCPICGHTPILTSGDMGRPNGHGYPGCTFYRLECSYCDIMPEASTDDIWDDSKDTPASVRVYDEWNKNCEEVEALLSWRDKKENK